MASATNEAMGPFWLGDGKQLSATDILLRFLLNNEEALNNSVIHFTLTGGIYVLVGYLPAL